MMTKVEWYVKGSKSKQLTILLLDAIVWYDICYYYVVMMAMIIVIITTALDNSLIDTDIKLINRIVQYRHGV